MSAKSKTTLSGVVVVGVVTIAIILQIAASGRRSEVRAAEEATARETTAAAPVRVEVAQPVRRPLTRVLKMPGTLLAGEAADLYAKTSGYISTVVVDIGSRVTKGEALITIDVPEMVDELRQAEAVSEAKRAKVGALQAKVAQAESMIATARAEVQWFAAEHELWKITAGRKKLLWEENAIAEQDLDESNSRLAVAGAQLRIAEAKVASAKAEHQSVSADVAVAGAQVAVEEAKVARIKTLMEYATVRAPFDGVITRRLVDPGAFVRSAADGTTTSLLTIANDSYIRLVLGIPESDVPYVHVGTKVKIDIKVLEGETITAAVTRTAVALEADTRTMRVEIDMDNPSGRLAPGMYARVTVTLEYKQQAIMIPSKAIRVRDREVSVWIAEGGLVKAKPIKIGYDDGIWVEVVEGLTGDEQIIFGTSSAVAPGARVTAVPVDL